MSNRDTSVAIKQANTQALNATQGHKPSYETNKLSTLSIELPVPQ